MIEPEDLIVPGSLPIHNRLAVDVAGGFDRATAETIAVRLSQLESKPVVGAYDASHLQQIHAHLFEGVFPWAGKLREPESLTFTSSLDQLFDGLARENRLKGLGGDTWSERSTEYFSELSTIQPFVEGNELASLEFFRQLAGENNMALRWTKVLGESPEAELTAQAQATERNNLRRVIMLAVDPYPTIRPVCEFDDRKTLELIAPT